MSRAEEFAVMPDKPKARPSFRNNNKGLSGQRLQADTSDIASVEQEFAHAPEFLTQTSDSRHDKTGADPQPETDVAAIELAFEQTKKPPRSKGKLMRVAAFAFYTAIFLATATVSAAVVLFVL